MELSIRYQHYRRPDLRAICRVALAYALVALCSVASARAAPSVAEPFPDATERIVGLARVWSKVKFYHPYLAYKNIDWDAALIAAIPKAEAAATVAEYRAAVQGMLAALGDPATRVVDPRVPSQRPSADWLTMPAPGVVEAKLAAFSSDPSDYDDTLLKAKQLTGQTAMARVVVLDMRGVALESYVIDALLTALPAIERWPLARYVEHFGYRPHEGTTSGRYHSVFEIREARPPIPFSGPRPIHAIFIVDAQSRVPSAAIALQASGRGTIVAHGGVDAASGVKTVPIDLPAKLVVDVRVDEPLAGPLLPDVTFRKAAEVESSVRTLARTLARKPPRGQTKKVTQLPGMIMRNDLDYPDTPYPSREHRLLAGIRIWAAVNEFLPYRYLIANWDGALRAALPRLIGAADRDAYLRALRQLAVEAGDGHIGVYPAVSTTTRGFPPFVTRLVEGKLTVAQLLDANEAGRLRVAPGDVIETIDGSPTSTKLAAIREVTSGSTADARDQLVALWALLGEDGTSLNVGVRGRDGTLRDVAVVRAARHRQTFYAPRPSPHWRRLSSTVGYADLTALTASEIAPMFAELNDTQAIVFDMRGYPNLIFRQLAPRVNTRSAKHSAEILTPLRTGEDDGAADKRVRLMQNIIPLEAGATLYLGQIVVLIDDRAVSRAEHTCLFLEQASAAKFVGSPTAGTNGDITTMLLPGGLRMSFTGQEIRHADGRQLQKIGMQPDIVVRPTLAGIRAGKDEVLGRALTYLATGR